MEFPKPIMSQNALVKLGIPKSQIQADFAEPDQQFAWQKVPGKRNSVIYYDTQQYKKFLLERARKQSAAREKANKYRNVC